MNSTSLTEIDSLALSMPSSERKKLLATMRQKLADLEARRQLERYRPYSKQLAFHAAGATHRERLLRAGNQLGKTWCGGAEAAYHLTGRYPDWWTGRRWDRPVMAWAAGVTGEATRDTVQRVLMGRPGQHGTGMIPADAIIKTMQGRGFADLLDTATVRHVSGGQSTLKFKTYDQGRERWQGETLDFVWFDEEPPPEIYTEGLTRTNATGGIAWLTFTPLLGMSEVVRRFIGQQHADRADICMTIEDAEHIPPVDRQKIIDAYPPHEREARAKGIPMLGSGRIYPVAEESIAVPAFAVPGHWAQLGALDFGFDHPTAGVRLAWDRDTDTVYVTAAYKVREQVPIVHAATLRHWGGTPGGRQWMPWAWPHDGANTSAAGGDPLAKQYQEAGLSMLPERAQFEDGSTSVEAGLMAILERMQTGRFKVFDHLADWLEECRQYHRKDGRIVKEFDDLMDATRYGIMSLRFARPDPNAPRPGVKDGYARSRRSGSWMTA